jgi:hypothetical protein
MKRFINWLFPKPAAPSVPVLRCRAGGMAWIQSRFLDCGAETLNGRAVKTVALLPSGKWRIEPPQYFMATAPTLFGERLYRAGDVVGIDGVADRALEPWKEDGVSDEEVRDLYAPKNTNKETV